MKNVKLLFVVGLMSLSLFSFASKQSDSQIAFTAGGGWEKLGSRMVNMRADHDEISVTAHEGFFTKVKLKVLKAPIHLLNIRIIFGNGEDKDVNFDRKFAAGTETPVIDLPGNNRVIKKINLNYKSVATGKGKAMVVVWGKH